MKILNSAIDIQESLLKILCKTQSYLAKEKLQSIGLKPINNIVILLITRFTYGQPLHAFDLDKISGDIINIKPKKRDFFHYIRRNREKTAC